MKCFNKKIIFFLAGAFVFIFSSSLCLAAELEEKGLQVDRSLTGGKVTLVKVIINAAEGGPKVSTLQLDYPASTILITSATLTVKKGSYKVELLENDKASLTLTAKAGKTVKGDCRLSVDAQGAVQYRVTAKKAKDVAFDLSFKPAQDDLRVSQAYSEEKLSEEGDGLNLSLACVAGKNCRLQAQNMSPSKAYRNILIQIDYKVMAREDALEKSRSCIIKGVLLPGKTGDWPISLVFGEPPKDMKISLITVDEVDPDEVTPPLTEQQKDMVIPLMSLESQKKSDVKAEPAAPSKPAPLPD
ncbi:MAG: hypothetical protein AB2L12_08935 [Smithellaceae bacterium]